MLLKPAYKITFGPPSSNGSSILSGVVGGGGSSSTIDTKADAQASTLISLEVNLDMAMPADSYRLVMGQVGPFTPTFQSEVKIELGDVRDSALTQVITGPITDMTPGIETRRVVGHSPAWLLLRTYADDIFQSKSADQLVRDLAKRANVDVDAADTGITFPSYVVDARRSVYSHIRDIADLCGCDFYVNSEGKLVFKKFTRANAQHTFNYGKHILDLDVENLMQPYNQIEVWGESPGGSKSSADWAWLTKDFSALKHTAGSGTPKMLLERSAIRDRTSAQTVGKALEARLKRETLRGRVLVAGYPAAKLGDSITLADLPNKDLNGTYQIRAVTHRITKRSGFTTAISFQRMPE